MGPGWKESPQTSLVLGLPAWERRATRQAGPGPLALTAKPGNRGGRALRPQPSGLTRNQAPAPRPGPASSGRVVTLSVAIDARRLPGPFLKNGRVGRGEEQTGLGSRQTLMRQLGLAATGLPAPAPPPRQARPRPWHIRPPGAGELPASPVGRAGLGEPLALPIPTVGWLGISLAAMPSSLPHPHPHPRFSDPGPRPFGGGQRGDSGGSEAWNSRPG